MWNRIELIIGIVLFLVALILVYSNPPSYTAARSIIENPYTVLGFIMGIVGILAIIDAARHLIK